MGSQIACVAIVLSVERILLFLKHNLGSSRASGL